jgi:hypothetical protein
MTEVVLRFYTDHESPTLSEYQVLDIIIHKVDFTNQDWLDFSVQRHGRSECAIPRAKEYIRPHFNLTGVLSDWLHHRGIAQVRASKGIRVIH